MSLSEYWGKASSKRRAAEPGARREGTFGLTLGAAQPDHPGEPEEFLWAPSPG